MIALLDLGYVGIVEIDIESDDLHAGIERLLRDILQ